MNDSFGIADYAAARSGIIALTKNAANELRAHNIQVNCISPVAITRMTDALFAFRDDHYSEHKAAAPRRDLVAAEAVPPAFVFFASQDSDLISGQVLALHPNRRLVCSEAIRSRSRARMARPGRHQSQSRTEPARHLEPDQQRHLENRVAR